MIMISEGSCDTEDWSNAENTALITEIILQYIHSFKINISYLYCIFDQINAAFDHETSF